MTASPTTMDNRLVRIILNRAAYWMSRYWQLSIGVLIGIWVGLPWLAPLFMDIGWSKAASAIYAVYATQCHQLPQRSFFLFGDQPMYSLPQVQEAWQMTNDPLVLRRFIGEAIMGWKVAWSDRMVYMYTSILVWGVLFWVGRRKIKPLPWWGLLLFLFPMAVDGFSHMVSDFTGGIGQGFRDNNAWLAALTDNAYPLNFYIGDLLGSFNSRMRLVTGLFFSLGIVWTFYPRLEGYFSGAAMQIEEKFRKAGLSL